MKIAHKRAASAVLLLVFSGAMLIAKDRIFVDQWSPTRSVIFIAAADGKNPRKLVAVSGCDRLPIVGQASLH